MHSRGWAFCGFGQVSSDMSTSFSYQTEWSRCPKSPPCATSPPPAPQPQSRSFPCAQFRHFQNVVGLESHSLQPLQTGCFYLTTRIAVSSMSFPGLIASFSFLALNNIPHLLRHLGCFQILAIMNKAAVNSLVQVFEWT